MPVLIDPKGCDWTKYRGVYGITPNIKELSDVAGFVINNNDSDIERIGRKVRETFQIENIFVTGLKRELPALIKMEVHIVLLSHRMSLMSPEREILLWPYLQLQQLLIWI